MPRHCRSGLWWLLGLAVGLTGGESAPVVDGPEGHRAFADLAAYYADPDRPPPYGQAVSDLHTDDAAVRGAAGRYLLALFRQSHADETNGRGPWRRELGFGGGSSSLPRELRAQGLAPGRLRAGQGRFSPEPDPGMVAPGSPCPLAARCAVSRGEHGGGPRFAYARSMRMP